MNIEKPFVRFYDSRDSGKTEARAERLGCKEAIEDFVQDVWRNPSASIRYPNADVSADTRA